MDGYITESMRERDGSPYSISRYLYDDEYNIIVEEKYYRKGYQSSPNNGKGNEIDLTSPFSISNFKYNDKRLKIEEKVFSNNELYSESKYKYDDEGSQIEEAYYKDDNLIWKEKHLNKYDSYGNITESAFIGLNEKIRSIWKYEYDELGRRVKSQLFNKNGDLRNTYKREYDNQGNVIKDDESEGLYKYEYDINLNWTKKIRYSNGNPSKIIEREIVYYD